MVPKEDRPTIMQRFKQVLYEKDQARMEVLWEELLDFDLVSKNSMLVAYLKTLYDYREAWAICYRTNKLLRGMQTNNSVESQFLVIKDKILNRTKEVGQFL